MAEPSTDLLNHRDELAAAVALLPPGTIGLSTINGATGRFVWFGQRFIGAAREDAHWTHVFIVADGPFIFEAMPAGIKRNPVDTYLDDLTEGDEVMFIQAPLTDTQREALLTAGHQLIDRRVGYSFLSYTYLTLRRLGWRGDKMRARIARVGDMICSQTADWLLTTVGVPVFTDNRAWQDVIPADFHKLTRTDPRFPRAAIPSRE